MEKLPISKFPVLMVLVLQLLVVRLFSVVLPVSCLDFKIENCTLTL